MNPDDAQALAERAAAVQRPVGDDASDVPSPCTSVCRMSSQSGFCEGCLRTLPEIAGWSRMEDEARRGVWRAIELRARAGLWRIPEPSGDNHA
ncbi:putative Fe-S protein YdhL (DUF1289 family) [Variovorax paradoxus]|uniref:Fe-S protein YdhL (DUF1289 family) n=1 Tax=Variovorax paradoxus TaxID=34073 RepID=A0AAE4BWD0_VARPD|nr:DUF1289 domain-containing protein [Variovorax paradoxus]MDR6426871.1 putative Fe-S protein YdhL (DUF1289 family) [Variovorax paradoxus]